MNRTTSGRSMPAGRRRWILDSLNAEFPVRNDELAKELGVSVETVRRDLGALESEGQVQRVRGGAMLTESPSRPTEPSFDDRASINHDGKIAMAQFAAALVGLEETIFLDVGTSVLEVARALPPQFAGVAVTNSLYAALEVAARTQASVHVLGGTLRPQDMVCAGPETVAGIREFRGDHAFLGSGGLSVDAGLTDYYPEEIAARRAMIAQVRRAHVLVDSSKLGQTAVRVVCGLDELHTAVTDDAADPDVVAELRATGLEVVVAPTPSSAASI